MSNLNSLQRNCNAVEIVYCEIIADINIRLDIANLENMTYFTKWEDFFKAAERLYLNDPYKVQ